MKMQGIVRLASVNTNGCCPNNERKIHQLKKAIKTYDVDILMLNEVNTKQNTMNISRIERKMKQIHRTVKIVENDSGQYHVTNNNYLPGGLLNIIFNKCAPIIQHKKITKERLGNWSAIALEYNGKCLELINLYQIPSSSSKGESCSYTQYILVDKSIKTVEDYRKEILQEIKHHIQKNEDITDIIIAGDYN